MNNMKKFVIILFVSLYLSFIIGHLALVHAEYVLPYPSFMPGNTLYKISTLLDGIKRYWSFGNIAQLKYRMSMADKKLVEAKTLFEYKQYAFAMNAIYQSSAQAASVPRYLEMASAQGIDMKEFDKTVCEQMNVHQEVLHQLRTSLPTAFTWQEEKKDAVSLPIQKALDAAIQTRVDVQTQGKCL